MWMDSCVWSGGLNLSGGVCGKYSTSSRVCEDVSDGFSLLVPPQNVLHQDEGPDRCSSGPVSWTGTRPFHFSPFALTRSSPLSSCSRPQFLCVFLFLCRWIWMANARCQCLIGCKRSAVCKVLSSGSLQRLFGGNQFLHSGPGNPAAMELLHDCFTGKGHSTDLIPPVTNRPTDIGIGDSQQKRLFTFDNAQAVYGGWFSTCRCWTGLVILYVAAWFADGLSWGCFRVTACKIP